MKIGTSQQKTKRLKNQNSSKSYKLSSRRPRPSSSKIGPTQSVFPMAAQAIDAQVNTVSPTLTLLVVHIQETLREYERTPKHSYRTWHETIEESLVSLAERFGIPFPVTFYNISPFWRPTIALAENQLNEQQAKSYVRAMEKATISEVLAYLMAVGLQAVYRGPRGYCRS